MELPKDIKEFVDVLHMKGLKEFNDGYDTWTFELDNLTIKKFYDQDFIKIGKNKDNQIAYLRIYEHEIESKIFVEENDEIFYCAFNLSELKNKKKTFKIAERIQKSKKEDFSDYLIDFEDCPGSLYWLAYSIRTSEYDANYSENRNIQALNIFEKLALLNEPRACHEIANKYYYSDIVDIDKVLEYRLKEIEYGEMYSGFRELADFIIDEYPEKINIAIDALQNMQKYNLNLDWSFWKEGRIYMKGIGCDTNYKLGFEKTKKASDLGSQLATSDLAYYYFKGIGVKKNLKKALLLLKQANLASTNFNKNFLDHEESDYDDAVKLIEAEIAAAK